MFLRGGPAHSTRSSRCAKHKLRKGSLTLNRVSENSNFPYDVRPRKFSFLGILSLATKNYNIAMSDEFYTASMAALISLQVTPTDLDSGELEAKQASLFANLQSLDQVVVAYSGGTDSAYLAWAAHRVLGNAAVAITADSPSIPES